jgi:uncharacterized lipoprotein YddW (UPF0748 family)
VPPPTAPDAARRRLHRRALAGAVAVLLAADVAVLATAAPTAVVAGAVAQRGPAAPTPEPALAQVAEADPAVVEPAPALPVVTDPPAPAPTPSPPPAAEGPPAPVLPTRIRGVWVHVLDDVLLSRASIARMLDTVVAGGGNTVVVEVARRYDAYYASGFLPRGNDPGFEPGLDVLAEVAAGARQRGLSVHAWYTAMPAWTPETARTPDPPNWTFVQHGRDVAPADSWVTYSSAGEPLDFLDPGHPAVQDLVVATAAELAAYDVDAVHLDYLRYPGADSGYNPVALGRFQAETGRTDVPAPTDPQFGDWRRQQTTDVLRRVRQAVQAVDPTVGISAALIAWGDGPAAGRSFEQTPAWTQVFQPWPQWMAEGLLDVAMPMLYFRESRHAGYHRNWTGFVAGLRQATGVQVAPGQGSWLNSVDESLVQLGEAAPHVDGEVLFSYQETAAGQGPDALLGALRQSLWSTPPAPG